MKIKKLIFRNILCFGNKTIEIDYENMGEGSLNIIMGKNGCGKSSFIKLHKLALYFESDGITGDGIANEINGNGFLAVEVDSNNNYWRIESEYTKTKLNSISVYKNGNKEPEDWGKIPETKKMINQQIIDIPYHIFSNILSLSIDDFKSFLSMSPKDTRNIRDRIFGFYILNEMNEKLKENIKQYNTNYQDTKSKISNLNEIIEETANKLREEKEKQEKNSKEKEEKIREDIRILNQDLANNLTNIEIQENKIKQLGLYSEKIANEELKKTILNLETNLETLEENEKKLSEDYSKLLEFLNDLKQDKQTYKDKQHLKSYKLAVEKVTEFSKQLKIKEDAFQQLGTELGKICDEYDILLFKKSWNDMINDVYGKLVNVDVIFHSYKSSNHSYDINKKTYDEQIDIINNCNEKIKEIKKENLDLQKEIDLYNQKKCPTCGNDFESSEFLRKIEDNKQKIERNNELIVNNEQLRKSADDKVSGIKLELDKYSKAIKADEQSYLIEYKNANQVYTQFLSSNHQILMFSYGDLLESIEETMKEVEKEWNNDSDDRKFGEIIKDFDSRYKFTYEEEKISLLESKKLEFENKSKIQETEINQIKSDSNSYQSIISSHNKEEIEKIESMHYKIQEINDKLIQSVEEKINNKENESLNQNQNLSKIKGDIMVIKDNIKNQKSKIKPEDYFSNLLIKEELSKEKIELLIQDSTLEIDDTNTAIAKIREDINSQTVELKSIEEIAKSNIKQLETIQNEYKEKFANLEKEEKKILVNLSFLKVVEYTLSDEGIKSFIIKKLVPAINKNISEILSQLEIPLVVKFDNEFKPTIYRYGKPVSLNSISTGQTKMIDSAITFTITKFLLSKCNGINIIFYDEIFSSLHTTAVATMMEIIYNELVKKLGLHVFLVNHSFISSAFFDNVFEFSVKEHFSRIDIKSIEDYNKDQL